MTGNNARNARGAAWRSNADLIIVLGVSVVAIAFIAVPPLSNSIIRIAVETSVLLFVPGYLLMAAIFPRKTEVGGFERVALSFGLSIAIVALLAFALNYGWNISVQSVATAVFLFNSASAIVAYARRHALPPQERLSVSFDAVVPLMRELRPRIEGRLQRGLVILLAISILFSASALAYSAIAPGPRETYTELYLLGAGGMMQDYPTNFTLGQNKSVNVAIANHENREINYSLVVQLTGSGRATTLYTGHQRVADGQTSVKEISLKPDRTGTNMRIDFFLYLDSTTATPYRQTYLLTHVTNGPK
jgi:uncharacterized membrane protein